MSEGFIDPKAPMIAGMGPEPAVAALVDYSIKLPASDLFFSLRAAASECLGRGIDLVVLFVPTKFRVYGPLCEFDADSPCRGWRADDLPEAIRNSVETVPGSIGFLDLTTVLRASAEKGARPYLRDDTHWSASGHRTAAEAVARLLLKRSGR